MSEDKDERNRRRMQKQAVRLLELKKKIISHESEWVYIRAKDIDAKYKSKQLDYWS